jgi:hypothetical protein
MIDTKPDEAFDSLSRRIKSRKNDIQVFLEHLQPTGRLLTNVNIVFGALASSCPRACKWL